MEILIYDGAPSVGVTHWVRDRIAPHSPSDTRFVGDFVSFRASRSRDALERLIMTAIESFRGHVDALLQSHGDMIVFDGSPLTYRALAALDGCELSTATIDQLRILSEDYRAYLKLVLLAPSDTFRTPANMRSFQPEQVRRFSPLLEGVYRESGFPDPTVIEVSDSPYNFPMRERNKYHILRDIHP